MHPKPATCDLRQIARLLRDDLEPVEQAALESHLIGCAVCRQSLEEAAADHETWQAAREFLSGDEAASGSEDESRAECELVELDAVLAGLAPSDDPRMLGRLGGYEISGVVGRGGMGIVLKGFDPALNRNVALKLLAPHLASSGAARQRFAREARAAAAVVHENVVAIHGVAEAGRLPYFVMPYIRGASLQKRLDREGPLEVAEVLRIALQTAAGLAAAHAQGLVHRDIKPANILLEDGVERLRITDFGLARAADDASLTRTGVIAGTPQYMSPEQACGELVDERSDLFSLGSVMYAMSAGRPPFRAETSYGVLRRICEDEPRPLQEVNPQVPDWLSAIVERLHQKLPQDRFQSAEEVAHLLEQCLAHVQQPGASPLPASLSKPVRKAKHDRRRWMFAGGALSALVLVAVAIAVAAASWWFTPPQRSGASGAAVRVGSQSAREPAAKSAATSADESSPADDWEGGITSEIEGLRSDVDELERRAAQLWDEAAVSP